MIERSGLIAHYQTEREGADRIENLERTDQRGRGLRRRRRSDHAGHARRGKSASEGLGALNRSSRMPRLKPASTRLLRVPTPCSS